MARTLRSSYYHLDSVARELLNDEDMTTSEKDDVLRQTVACECVRGDFTFKSQDHARLYVWFCGDLGVEES